MKITLVPIAEIKPFEKNAKLHPAEQIDRIAKSITQYGFNQPIVVDKDNVIIVGHGRHAAALKLGIVEVPVVKLDISPEKARQYRLVDNKTNESDWDIKLLIEELKEVKGFEFEPKDFGFDIDLSPIESGKNSEIGTNDLGLTSTVSFKFPHSKYLDVLQAIAQIKEAHELSTDEEVLDFLLENYAV